MANQGRLHEVQKRISNKSTISISNKPRGSFVQANMDPGWRKVAFSVSGSRMLGTAPRPSLSKTKNPHKGWTLQQTMVSQREQNHFAGRRSVVEQYFFSLATWLQQRSKMSHSAKSGSWHGPHSHLRHLQLPPIIS
jgi:hypothetical protein